jgi:ABC-type sugar transport system substrate-binding protein
MAMFAQQAIVQSGKDVPLEIAVIGIDGTRKA